jgi:hypothetical protein
MKPTIVVIFISLISYPLIAQDSAIMPATSQPSANSSISAEKQTLQKIPHLSIAPGAQELADLFISAGGEIDEAMKAVAGKGENAVEGLTQLLFSETITGSQGDQFGEMVLPVNKVYAVLALEAIACDSGGNALSTAALIQVANSHTNPEIRGVALNSIANVYYKKVVHEKLLPNMNVIGALVQNASDTTFVFHYQRPIDQIVQEGLIHWLGLDFGDPQFYDMRTKNGKKTSVEEFCKHWFKDYKQKLIWNNETNHFEAK